MALVLWPYDLIFDIFRSFSSHKVATINKTTPRGSVLSWQWNKHDVSSPILFCVLPGKPHRGQLQGEEKSGNKVPFQNICFLVVTNAAYARSPDKIKQF